MKFWHMKIRCLQGEGVDCSSFYMRASEGDFEGSHRVPYGNLQNPT